MSTELNSLMQWCIKHEIIEKEYDFAAFKSLKRLDLSGKKLEYIPDEIGYLTELSILNLSNNRLEGLPNTLYNLKSLINLDLRRNRLTSIEPIRGLNLRSLNLGFNRIRSLEPIKGMNELKVLDVSANELVNIDAVLSSLSGLRNLNASYNYIEHIVLSPSIESLQLAQNVLYELSGENLSLIRADLSDNKFEEIPECLSESRIEILDMSSNKLHRVIFNGMSGLKSLNLDNNPGILMVFSSDFALQLEEFSCVGCGISEMVLPPSNHLINLDYSSNRLKHIDTMLAGYRHLEILDLSHNCLSNLPDDIRSMKTLKTLFAEDNPFDPAFKNEILAWEIESCSITTEHPVSITTACEHDLVSMAQLLSQLFSIEADFGIDYEKQLKGLQLLFTDSNCDMIVAKAGEQIVGMVTMQRVISTAEGGYAGMIEDLIVDEKHRGMKIGTRLIRKMLHIAREKGYCRIQLAADKDNESGKIFYRQRGFRQTNLTVFHLTESL